MDEKDRFRGCLLGLAAGDAVGTTVEFRSRGSFEPLTGLTGGGPFNLRPGQWTDDTSMALCLATSLLETGRFDPEDQMNRYCRWAEFGYLSSTGTCFDIGNTVSAALRRFRRTGDPISGTVDGHSAGNGCIMRLAPIPMFFFPDMELSERFAEESSRTTHGAKECLDGCRLLSRMIVRALSGQKKDETAFADGPVFEGSPKICAIARGDYMKKTARDLKGSGYVVDCLEAALWCFMNTGNFEAAILAAANLGDDADTTAAVCGQVAGAFYGEPGIPAEWLDKLSMAAEIRNLADRLMSATKRP